jgi:hypothetical protein
LPLQIQMLCSVQKSVKQQQQLSCGQCVGYVYYLKVTGMC